MSLRRYLSDEEVHYYNNALRIERLRPEQRTTNTVAEERAAAYYALTGERTSFRSDAGRQTTDKNVDKLKPEYKKSHRKYVFEESTDEESTDEESKHASSSSKKVKNWVDVVSESSEPTFQTGQSRPTPSMLRDQAIQRDRDDHKVERPASPVHLYPSRPTSHSARTSPSKRDEHSREPEPVERTVREERRETKFTSMIRTLTKKQASSPRSDKLHQAESYERERKPLNQRTMPSQRSDRSYEHKPLGQYTMSSQKSYVRECPPAYLENQDSDYQSVTVRGDIRHEHHHHHHHHVPEPQVSGSESYGPFILDEPSPQLVRAATITSDTTSVTRNHQGDLQFERKASPKRSKSTNGSKMDSSKMVAAKIVARGYGWNL
ncbi:hypothetical protein H2198_006554 [Neophaeococcomyces mojaviensis]|uniref:Uncharacterized protein n=1 Tax=Neophaeococcomyces mojaviensis TaxID=3383035 RepID=A0ACC3A2K9_9EURO|nr:hypothetical protein H2198_006554 [Knufia sp. JES_112]